MCLETSVSLKILERGRILINIITNQFIVKQKPKQQWHFFHQDVGICFRRKTKTNGATMVLRDGQKDFDVLIDLQNNIHIMCKMG